MAEELGGWSRMKFFTEDTKWRREQADNKKAKLQRSAGQITK
jgi:hypothetical protein